MSTKLKQIEEIARVRNATLSRATLEITEGIHAMSKVGWNTSPALKRSDRKGLIRLCRKLRSHPVHLRFLATRRFDKFTSNNQPLPLP